MSYPNVSIILAPVYILDIPELATNILGIIEGAL